MTLAYNIIVFMSALRRLLFLVLQVDFIRSVISGGVFMGFTCQIVLVSVDRSLVDLGHAVHRLGCGGLLDRVRRWLNGNGGLLELQDVTLILAWL